MKTAEQQKYELACWEMDRRGVRSDVDALRSVMVPIATISRETGVQESLLRAYFDGQSHE
jgi:hypothetical protein